MLQVNHAEDETLGKPLIGRGLFINQIREAGDLGHGIIDAVFLELWGPVALGGSLVFKSQRPRRSVLFPKIWPRIYLPHL